MRVVRLAAVAALLLPSPAAAQAGRGARFVLTPRVAYARYDALYDRRVTFTDGVDYREVVQPGERASYGAALEYRRAGAAWWLAGDVGHAGGDARTRSFTVLIISGGGETSHTVNQSRAVVPLSIWELELGAGRRIAGRQGGREVSLLGGVHVAHATRGDRGTDRRFVLPGPFGGAALAVPVAGRLRAELAARYAFVRRDVRPLDRATRGADCECRTEDVGSWAGISRISLGLGVALP